MERACDLQCVKVNKKLQKSDEIDITNIGYPRNMFGFSDGPLQISTSASGPVLAHTVVLMLLCRLVEMYDKTMTTLAHIVLDLQRSKLYSAF